MTLSLTWLEIHEKDTRKSNILRKLMIANFFFTAIFELLNITGEISATFLGLYDLYILIPLALTLTLAPILIHN